MSQDLTIKNQWRDDLKKMEPQFAVALPRNIPPERFVRATETAVMRDLELLKCDRKSLFQAVMQSAESGLMPNGRDAALVRFKGQVQFIPMIGGILKLMRNTGEIASIVCEIVGANDEFDYQLGDDPYITHKPNLDDRGDVIAAYAVISTKDGAKYRDVMSRGEIEKVRRTSRAQNGPWNTWFEEMAKKTVLRRLAKRCPLSTDKLLDLSSADDNMYDFSAAERQPSISDRMQAKLEQANEPEQEPEDPPQDAEFEDLPEDQAEPETATTEQPEAPEDDAVVYKDDAEAIAEIERALKNCKEVDDIKNYLDGWKLMVGTSFEGDALVDVVKRGSKLCTTRKLEIQKAQEKK